ncbi:hypothetical protein MBLNU13_g09256t1 [Cladosporium sp. NU13]
MDSTASWQTPNAQHPNLWLDINCTLEPRTLDQTQEFEAAFDAWLNAVPSELQSPINCANPTPPSVSDYGFLPSPELSPSPTTQKRLYDEPTINAAQDYSGINVQISDLQAQRRPAKLSTSSWDTDYSQDESCRRLSCSECTRTFENLSALNRHTQSTSHKAWRCIEAGCEKTYARRDTFLRHRVAHRDDALNHVCLFCLQINKSKVFRRKDHLRDHMRKCHSKGIERKAKTVAPLVPVQKQAMKELVRSLGTVLGEQNKCFIEDLGDKMNALSGPDIESIAQGMAGVALAKTYFSTSNTTLESGL